MYKMFVTLKIHTDGLTNSNHTIIVVTFAAASKIFRNPSNRQRREREQVYTTGQCRTYPNIPRLGVRLFTYVMPT